MKPYLVFENYSAESCSSIEDIARDFCADQWLVASCDNVSVTVLSCSSSCEVPSQFLTAKPVLEFYSNLATIFPEDVQIIRIRNPYPPSHPLVWKEICAQFPIERFDYVLSTADECGFQGYFVERFNLQALKAISRIGHPCVMPPGYLNGMALKAAGRHWHSLELRRFYLQEHFATLYDSPRWVAINAIPGCNYRCEKCQYHSPRLENHTYAGTPMSLEKFGAVIEKCRDFKRLASIAPTISGEPLLHPDIVTMVSMVKQAGYSCGFATNAALLTRDLSIKLLEAGVDGLAFSVDSINPDTYRKLQGGDLDLVVRNILAFKEETIRQRGSFSGSIICVVSRENEHEIEEYRRIWLERGFTVIFSAEHDISANYRPYFAHAEWAPKHRMPCFSLWLGLYLTVEGRPVVCGSMAKTKGIRESIFESAPADLWHGDTMTELREQQLTGKTPHYCREFSCWTGQMTTWVNRSGRLLCHTQGSWMEQPPAAVMPGHPPTHLSWYKKFRTFSLRFLDR